MTTKPKKREPVWTTRVDGKCIRILRKGVVTGYVDTHYGAPCFTDEQLVVAARAACRALNAAERRGKK